MTDRPDSRRGKRERRSRSRAPRRAPGGVGGRDLLWPGDPAIWPDISPILYPVVGWTRERRGAGRRQRPIRSACMASPASRLSRSKPQAPDFVRLTLSDNERTRAVYPFAFTLRGRIPPERRRARHGDRSRQSRRAAARLTPAACIRASAGRSATRGATGAFVRFEREERAEVPVIAPGGLVATKTKPVPFTRPRPPADRRRSSPATPSASSIAGAARSPSSTPPAPRSRWSSPTISTPRCGPGPARPYICLEAWTGYSDPEGFAGDLFEKPSMRVLEPGERARHEARFVYRAA